MTVTLELGLVALSVFLLGCLSLVVAIVDALTTFNLSRRLRSTPLPLALFGAAFVLMPMTYARPSSPSLLFDVAVFAVPWSLIVAGALVERATRSAAVDMKAGSTI